jgi:hypothetical protein
MGVLNDERARREAKNSVETMMAICDQSLQGQIVGSNG